MCNIISPLDGRYSSRITEMAEECNEYKVMQAKVAAEIKYLLFFLKTYKGIKLSEAEINDLKNLYKEFRTTDFEEINKIERYDTHHDIKAIEYWIRRKIEEMGYFITEVIDSVHYGITSQDIVSLGTYLTVVNCFQLIRRKLSLLKVKFDKFKEDNVDVRFIARTHGQPAIATTVSREVDRYCHLLGDNYFRHIVLSIKFGGAVGSLAFLKREYTDHDVETEFSDFITSLSEDIPNLTFYRSQHTSQTDHWDSLIDMMHSLEKTASGMINICRDFWMYYSYGYIITNVDKGYCGSSTMPQKINPIKFENAEGCFEKVEADFQFLCRKLHKSRLQRDLSDSVVIRMIYETFSWMYLGITSLTDGISSIRFNKSVCDEELENNYQILAEFVQLTLKKYNTENEDVYALVKDKFRGLRVCTRKQYLDIIDSLDIEDEYVRELLKNMTPKDYC